jgi:hypothetical protein
MQHSMKKSVVRHNLMVKFQHNFDTLWNDSEFGFKGDDNLITTICASLSYEQFYPE